MSVKMVVVIRRDLNMRKGKMCAQASHASMKFLSDRNTSDDPSRMDIKLTSAEQKWFKEGFAKIVVSVDSEQALGELMNKAKRAGIQVCHIIDSGKTEFHGVPTMTCAAFGPAEAEELDPITGDLPLL